jgi:hypothetical protein
MYGASDNIRLEAAVHYLKALENVGFLSYQLVQCDRVITSFRRGNIEAKSLFEPLSVIHHDLAELVLVTGLEDDHDDLVHDGPSQIVIDAIVSVGVKELLEEFLH